MVPVWVLLVGYNLSTGPSLLERDWNARPYIRFQPGERCPKCGLGDAERNEWPSMAGFYEEARATGIFARQYSGEFTGDRFRMFRLPYILYLPYSLVCFGVVFPVMMIAVARRLNSSTKTLGQDEDRLRKALERDPPEAPDVIKTRIDVLKADVAGVWRLFAVVAVFCVVIVFFEFGLGCHTLADAALGLALLAYFGVLACVVTPVTAWLRYANWYQTVSLALREDPDILEKIATPADLLFNNLRNPLLIGSVTMLSSSIPAFEIIQKIIGRVPDICRRIAHPSRLVGRPRSAEPEARRSARVDDRYRSDRAPHNSSPPQAGPVKGTGRYAAESGELTVYADRLRGHPDLYLAKQGKGDSAGLPLAPGSPTSRTWGPSISKRASFNSRPRKRSAGCQPHPTSAEVVGAE